MCEVKQSFFDPRSKIALMLTLSGLLIQCGLSTPELIWNGVLLSVPVAVFLAARKIRKAVVCALLWTTCLLLLALLLPGLSGVGAIALSGVCAVLVKIVPGISFSLHVISTIEAAELIAALDRMRLPKTLIWTLSMVLRFFPTVGEELSASWDGIRMRGHSLSHCMLHPIGTLVDVFIPLVVSVVNIGDELLMATLTKGFSVHAPRTSISMPRLRARDFGVMALCCVGWLIRFFMR